MKRVKLNAKKSNLLFFFTILITALQIVACSSETSRWDNADEEGAFLVFRRQSQIGEETYSITSTKDSVIVKSLQGENERGRISGVVAELRMDKNLVPYYYNNQRITNDTTNLLKVERASSGEITVLEEYFDEVTTQAIVDYFPLHSNIPAAMEMMLYHYYFKNGEQDIPTLPRGEVSIRGTGTDTVTIEGEKIPLTRYVVEGINWGGRTVWLDESNNLVALVKANTQIREIIRKGYEDALPVFVAGNVTEQMNQLDAYTAQLQKAPAQVTALVGGNVITGLSETSLEDMTVIVEDGSITSIEKSGFAAIPPSAEVIDVTGKTLMPGLWDMHAHSNQVQWAPAYLAGGVTTIRDNGNELEFATAFRDAIAQKGKMGPDILLAGMTDGPGIRGNGVVRATSVEQAKQVAELYHSNGYKQIKIYNSIEPDILKVLAEEGHARGMTVTGHVPQAVGNAVNAINSGMDMLSHKSIILSVLFPDSTISDMPRNYVGEYEVTPEQIQQAIDFYLENGTVLDPTVALYMVRALPFGTPIEAVEPDAGRIAYELFEGKRFRGGMSEERARIAQQDNTRSLEILGQFFKAGIPVVAGTDNAVPVFNLYLEMESYHKVGGLSKLEAIRSATIVPATAMGMGGETGTLEVGKQADIAILDQNPLEDISNIRTVSAVMSNGNYYKSAPLWEAADFKPNRE